jgi:hypothetical protein
MTFAVIGGLAGAAAGAAGIGGLTIAAGAGLGLAAGGALGALSSSRQQSGAAQDAAGIYAASGDRASDIQRQMFERQVELQRPFREAGEQALNKLIPASDYQTFGMQQFQADPGYAFRLSEGQKALERSAAARGGLMSGGALKAAQRYGQEMGSQEYQNAFNRYQTEQQSRLNPLQSLAGLGQTGAQNIGSAAQQYGVNVGNIGMGAGAAQGNALMAGAQARGSAYQGIGQSFGNLLGQPSFQKYLSGFDNTTVPMQPGGGY